MDSAWADRRRRRYLMSLRSGLDIQGNGYSGELLLRARVLSRAPLPIHRVNLSQLLRGQSEEHSLH